MNLNVPRVSIVIPLFNKEAEVGRAIKSVLAGTVTNFEIIVVNDGSSDNGGSVARAINDPRIRVIDQSNTGVSGARNRGIDEARADLIAFMDADDEWLPHFLETIGRLRSRFPSCSVFATNYIYRNIDGSLMPAVLRGIPAAGWEGVFENYFKVASQSDPPISSSAVAVTKAALTSIGGFPMGVRAGEDLITWAKLASEYKIAYSKLAGAVIYLRESLWGPPTREPDSADIVGQDLEKILKAETASAKIGMKEYIAHWHQMRASIYLRLGKRKAAIYEIREIARYSKKNLKLYTFLITALMPQKISRLVFRSINYWQCFRRRIIISGCTSNIPT